MPETNHTIPAEVKTVAAEVALSSGYQAAADNQWSENNVKSILIVGVGGQGTLLASRVLAQALLMAGADVKVSEVHGMAQRGGSVVTHVRYGPRVFAPLVQMGQVDYILAFEKLEAIRWLPYLKKGGWLIVNDQAIDPLPVLTGAAKYPEEIPEKISRLVENLLVLDATPMAEEVGNVKATNIVLLAVLAGLLDLTEETWERALEKAVPAKVLEVNKEAFKKGYAFITNKK